MKQPSFHDIEQISAYLDDALDARARASLERRLADDPQLDAVYQSMREARTLLRRLPQRRVPRNFTLTPHMAGVRPPLPRAYPALRWASLVATLLFVFAFALNSTALILSARPLAVDAGPMLGMGGGPEVDQTLAVEAAPAPALAERPQSGGGCEGVDCPSAELELTAPPEGARIMATQPAAPEFAKQTDAPEAAMEASDQPTDKAPAPLLPPALLGALLTVALLLGGAAYLLRWQTDRAFARQRAQNRSQK